jgi:hypothetical protein
MIIDSIPEVKESKPTSLLIKTESITAKTINPSQIKGIDFLIALLGRIKYR